MATKTDFSSVEWETLRDAPNYVVIAVAAAGGSGLFGSLKEAIAPAGAIVEALKGENELLREVCNKDEMKAAIEALKEEAKAQDFKTVQANFRKGAIEKSRAALEVLRQKGAEADANAYAAFVTNLAERVANAAKEGSFLGFGGERVSENERTLLAELSQALGMGGASGTLQA
jgi:hypothetical protein